MTVRVGINGFGRIGRNFFRAAQAARRRHRLRRRQRPRLARHDGPPAQVRLGPRHAAARRSRPPTDGIKVDGDELKVLAERDPAELPWGDLGVDVVVESTGFFTARDKAAAHLDAGAPLVDRVGARRPAPTPRSWSASTTHASTPKTAQGRLQRLLHDQLLRADGQGPRRRLRRRAGPDDHDPRLHRRPDARRRPAQDLRRARAAAINIVPTSHRRRPGHALVLESMKGKLDGTSLRVPVPTGSITDFIGILEAEATVDEINAAFAKAAESGPLKGILVLRGPDRVDRHRRLDPHSCIFDSELTMGMGNLVKVLGWYDNEWGYSNRLVDLMLYAGKKRRPRQLNELAVTDARSRRSRTSSAARVARRQADPRPRRLQRAARRRRARSPTTSASAPRCRRSSGCRSAAPRVVAASHLGRPKGKPDPKYSMDPVRGPARRAGARRRAAREPALRPGRGGQRPGLRRPAGRGHRRLRQRRLRRLAPRPRLDRRAAAVRSRRRGPPAAARGRGAARAARRARSGPFVAVLGGAKVCDKLGVIEALLDIVDALVIGGGDVLHVPRRAGPPDRRLAVRARPGRHVPRLLARRSEQARSTCRPTSSALDRRRRRRHVRHDACPTARRASTSAPARRPSSATS